MTAARRDGGDYWPAKAPRLPGPGPKRSKGRRPFGATWWGRAWVEALEQRARLDPNRLPRGRTYARQGAVGELEVLPGEVVASVQGSRRTPYRVRVRVRPFSAKEWTLVVDGLAGQAGHSAALLEGEIPPEVADDVRAVGLDLLPGPGEVQPRCSCPDWADPCKHASAVCYLVADLLDQDPFALFQLRGRGREELLAALRARRAAGSGDGGPASPAGRHGGALDVSARGGWEEDPGVVARQAWGRTVADLPSLPPPPRRPGRPVVLASEAPTGSGIDTNALAVLAGDAARRAWEIATGGRETGLGLSFDQDLARWAASTLDGGVTGVELPALAERAGLTVRELFLRALAWKAGGPGGVAALLEAWDPPAADLAAGRAELGSGARASRNRVSLGDRQLRLGRDGCWYSFRKVRGAWEPDGQASR